MVDGAPGVRGAYVNRVLKAELECVTILLLLVAERRVLAAIPRLNRAAELMVAGVHGAHARLVAG